MSTINTLPWITFTLNGATITVQETPTAPPVSTEKSTSVSEKSSQSSKSSSPTSKTTSASLSPTTSVTTTTAGTTSSSSLTSTGYPFSAPPSSCVQSTTTLSDLEQSQAFATACPVFEGNVLIASDVSTSIDLNGLAYLNGSLISSSSQNGGFTSLYSDILDIYGNMAISNNKNLWNISFPRLQLITGELNIFNNFDLQDFNSMSMLSTVQGGIGMNGTFASISFPQLTKVAGVFNVDSSEDLDCEAVAPLYKGNGGALLSCTSANSSEQISVNGTLITNNIPGPRGFNTKDEIIVGVIVGVVVLVLIGLGYWWWLRRQAMAHVAAMARAPRQNHRNSALMSGQPTPRPTPSFHVQRASDSLAEVDPHLWRQLQELNEKANRPGGLNAHQIARREWINTELRETAERMRASGVSLSGSTRLGL